MKIKIINPKHMLFNRTYDVVNEEKKRYAIELHNGMKVKVFKEDCEVVKDSDRKT